MSERRLLTVVAAGHESVASVWLDASGELHVDVKGRTIATAGNVYTLQAELLGIVASCASLAHDVVAQLDRIEMMAAQVRGQN